MNSTDALIEQLAGRAGQPSRSKRLAFYLPLAAAALVSVIALLALLGPPFASVAENGWAPMLRKWLFCFTLTGGALVAMYALAHPGRRSSVLLLAALAPLAMVAGLALIEFTGGLGEFPGPGWERCVLAVGLLGALGMAASVYALRLLAPVRLRRAGFAAGLFGGGLAACAYVPFCGEMGAIHLLVFYGGPISALAVLGWLLGPRILRW